MSPPLAWDPDGRAWPHRETSRFVSAAEQAARLLPHAELAVLAGLGHLAHEERADLVAQAMSAPAPVPA